ncbi:unnamed protein product [Rotaria socialis]|uniref:Anoctamin n=1 Tax=Rotaria socialis TaxID=392032 RepID=A0A821GN80_9BILA|nr:unnamed protein product [Rotaria socialis]
MGLRSEPKPGPGLKTVVQRIPMNELIETCLDRLIARRVYDTYFPLHESKALRNNVTDANNRDLGDREKLKKYWATMRQFLKFQPLLLVRSYMGEKIAFYFAFIGFYNQTLILPSIVGIIIFIYGAATVATDQPTSDICGNFGNTTYMCPRCDKECPFWRLSDSCIYSNASYVFDNAATLVFAIFMSIWGRLFVKLWKRHQAVLQYDWDSIDFQEHFEPIRPKFEKEALKKGLKTNNPVTNEIESSIPIRKRVPFFLITTIVVLFTVLKNHNYNCFLCTKRLKNTIEVHKIINCIHSPSVTIIGQNEYGCYKVVDRLSLHHLIRINLFMNNSYCPFQRRETMAIF